jgi:hypothetical protein
MVLRTQPAMVPVSQNEAIMRAIVKELWTRPNCAVPVPYFDLVLVSLYFVHLGIETKTNEMK